MYVLYQQWKNLENDGQKKAVITMQFRDECIVTLRELRHSFRQRLETLETTS
jgi:hypothetical protein